MRGNIIEELYYGNIDPQDRGYSPKSPVKKASDSLNDLEEKLTEKLPKITTAHWDILPLHIEFQGAHRV